MNRAFQPIHFQKKQAVDFYRILSLLTMAWKLTVTQEEADMFLNFTY